MRFAYLAPIFLASMGCAVRADLGATELLGSVEGGGIEAPVNSAANDAGMDAQPAARAKVDSEPGPDAEADQAVVDHGSSSDGAPDVRVDAPTAQTAETGVPSACDDNLRDGDETDVDCGGACAPCGLAQHCRINADCGMWPGCDPLLGCACDASSLTCVYNHCSDYKQDEGETSVDCGGGECPGCGPNKACILDSDCSSTLAGCDTNGGGCYCDLTTQTCVYNHCYDHKWDAVETATDCGGGQCPGCAKGQGCKVDVDCASNACDAQSLVCVSTQCSDHRLDGNETDVDCGGPECGPCATGLKCKTPFDCASGFCNASLPPVCN